MSKQLVRTEVRAGLLAAVPLTDPSPFRAVGMRRRRDASHSPLSLHFMSVLREVGAVMSKGVRPSVRR